MKKIVFALSIIICMFSCHSGAKKTQSVSIAVMNPLDPHFSFANGFLYFNKILYTGSTLERYPNGKIKKDVVYLDGKENGAARTFYEKGERETERFYTHGEKDSIHKGWWPGGRSKFEYNFKSGNYNGYFTEWYENGQINQQIIYADGKEISGRGWRENGRLYMNFIWRGNRRYGLVNPNMCYGLENGKIK